MKLLEKHFRSQLFRAFQSWYARNQHRLPYRFILTNVTKHHLELRLAGVQEAISIRVDKQALSICVDWQGTCWDMLLSLDVIPMRSEKGCYCAWCALEGKQDIYSSRKELWEDLFFEPLARWLEERLKPATLLCLNGSLGESTSARLVVGNDNPPSGSQIRLLPIRTHQACASAE